MGRKLLNLKAGALLVAAGFLAYPGSASAETLAEALTEAWTNNPSLSAERQGFASTKQNRWVSISGFLPTVNLQATKGEQEDEGTSLQFVSATTAVRRPFSSDIEPETETATATWQIFTGGQRWYGLRQTGELISASQAGLAGVGQNVLLQVVSAYMNVVRDRTVVELNRKQVEVLTRQQQATQDRFDVGEITRTDVAQATARLSGAQSGLFGAEAQLRASRASYVRFVGHEPGDLEQRPPLPKLPDTEAEALDIALQYHPNLRAARHSEKAADHAVRAARGTFLPTLTLQAKHQETENTSQTLLESESESVTAIASWDIFSGGRDLAGYRQKEFQASQQRLLTRDVERQVVEAIANAWEGLRATRSSLQAGKDQVKAAEIALDGVKQEAEVGSRTTLDVLNAEKELLDARVALRRTERDETVAAFQLLSAMGLLSLQNLGLTVSAGDEQATVDGEAPDRLEYR